MRKALLALSATAMLAVGCSKITYVNPQVPRGGAVHTEGGSFFIFGLVGEKTIPVFQMCPNGVAQMQSKASVLDLVLGFITIGIYTPRTYEIECGR